MVNEKFGTAFTVTAIGSTLKRMGLQTGCPRGALPGERPKLFSPEQDAFIVANNRGVGHQQMADMVNEKFGTSFTKTQIEAFRSRNHLDSGLTGHFEKGHTPKNKGRHWDEYMTDEARERSSKSHFKKGSIPHNYKPIGYERVNVDGYVEVKVRDLPTGETGKNFVLKHRLIYEQNFGPIPDDCIVSFRDGDKRNFSPDNLVLIQKRINAVLNHSHLRTDSPELLETSMLTAELIMATREKKKQVKKKN